VQGGEGLNLEAYIYNSQTAESRQIAKRYLVPQGEYVPTAYSNLFTLFGQEAVVDYIEDHINYVVGGYTTQTNLPVDTPAILFCFESVDPMGVRRLTQEHPHAPFVSHPISHAWFNQSEILWNQLDSMLRVQALWNNTYIVSASNQGRSQLYTPQGSVLDMDEIASGENWSVKKVEIFLP
jgi:apolipoprotein N-acyltransferase